MLSHAQKVGAQYFEHLHKLASREEAEAVAVSGPSSIQDKFPIFHQEFMRNTLSSKYEVIIAGG